MISTRHGTQVDRLISKDTDANGNLWIKLTLVGMDGEREVFRGDLRATGGLAEVDAAVDALPAVTSGGTPDAQPT